VTDDAQLTQDLLNDNNGDYDRVAAILNKRTNQVKDIIQRYQEAELYVSEVMDESDDFEDSNKILRAAQIARDLAQQGRKSIIWCLFYDNIDRLVFLLDDLGARALDGRVPSGSRTDPETREGRIANFHLRDDRMILVANPAACSEGISLQRVCHDAIYLERSYNAGHYLQSIDRIHRLGIEPPDAITNVTILQSVATHATGSIDHSVSLRMRTKMRAMVDALDDPDIGQLLLDEEAFPVPIVDADFDDLADLLEQLLHGRLPNEDELQED
jgi:hypothetical protein